MNDVNHLAGSRVSLCRAPFRSWRVRLTFAGRCETTDEKETLVPASGDEEQKENDDALHHQIVSEWKVEGHEKSCNDVASDQLQRAMKTAHEKCVGDAEEHMQGSQNKYEVESVAYVGKNEDTGQATWDRDADQKRYRELWKRRGVGYDRWCRQRGKKTDDEDEQDNEYCETYEENDEDEELNDENEEDDEMAEEDHENEELNDENDENDNKDEVAMTSESAEEASEDKARDNENENDEDHLLDEEDDQDIEFYDDENDLEENIGSGDEDEDGDGDEDEDKNEDEDDDEDEYEDEDEDDDHDFDGEEEDALEDTGLDQEQARDHDEDVFCGVAQDVDENADENGDKVLLAEEDDMNDNEDAMELASTGALYDVVDEAHENEDEVQLNSENLEDDSEDDEDDNEDEVELISESWSMTVKMSSGMWGFSILDDEEHDDRDVLENDDELEDDEDQLDEQSDIVDGQEAWKVGRECQQQRPRGLRGLSCECCGLVRCSLSSAEMHTLAQSSRPAPRINHTKSYWEILDEFSLKWWCLHV